MASSGNRTPKPSDRESNTIDTWPHAPIRLKHKRHIFGAGTLISSFEIVCTLVFTVGMLHIRIGHHGQEMHWL